MWSFPLWFLFSLGPLLVITACFAGTRPCYTPDEAQDRAGKDICLAAHVYDVVEARDGTRYLDVCPPEKDEASCRFTVMSVAADRKEVGELEGFREQDVHLRGTVHTVHGQSVMLLSHARQFHDGAEKFRPNPELISGFNADREGTAFRDPTLSASHRKAESAFKSKTLK